MYKYNVMGITLTNNKFNTFANHISGKVHPKKMQILSSFTHPHAIPNLYEFSFSVKEKK